MSEINDPVSDSLAGLVAIVTGGGQGLGLGTARHLAHHGAQVFILDKAFEVAQAAAKTLPRPHLDHAAVACDVTHPQQRLDAVDTVLKRAGQIDVLVNNAGITHVQPWEEMDEQRWREVFDVNVHAVMAMSRDAGRHMLARGSGSIINIGSITTLVGFPRRGPYATAKTAVLGMTRTLAVEWAQRGVRVNAIGPGYHDTPLFRKYADMGVVDVERIRKRIPAGRLGSIDDVGRVAVFFASPLSAYVTGQFLMVDGGYTAFGAAEDASL